MTWKEWVGPVGGGAEGSCFYVESLLSYLRGYNHAADLLRIFSFFNIYCCVPKRGSAKVFISAHSPMFVKKPTPTHVISPVSPTLARQLSQKTPIPRKPTN